MSTEYYLKSLPEKDLQLEISKQVRRSLIEEHKLTRILELLKEVTSIENETVRVLNKGVRGPYAESLTRIKQVKPIRKPELFFYQYSEFYLEP